MHRLYLLLCLLFLCPVAALPQVLINEYLTSNTSGLLDEDQEYSDWIEFYNSSDNPVNMTGYSLTDDLAVPARWTFPAMTLPAHQYVKVFASGKDRKALWMNFETVIDIGTPWHYIVPQSDMGTAWLNNGFDDSSWSVGNSSFGYADGDDTTLISSSSFSIFIRKEFTISSMADIGRVILSIDYDDGFVAYINGHEIARSNLGTPLQNVPFDMPATNSREAAMYLSGTPEYYDVEDIAGVLQVGTNVIAIQVHNNTVGSSDLSAIPFLTIGRFNGEAGYVSPFLSFAGGLLHTNFKIDAGSESIFLFNKSGALVDSAAHIAMPSDVSRGRMPDGSPSWCFFGYPTPGRANTPAGSGLEPSSAVTLSPSGGKFRTSAVITMSSADPADSVYYTMDGTIPDKSDYLYKGQLTIATDRIIRARTIRTGKLPGPVKSSTYVGSRTHDIPFVCLSTNPENLWNENYGIYAFGTAPRGDYPYFNANFWKDWERPVHMELYDVQGVKKVDQDAGMKIFGAWSRAADQKSLALYARKTYGKGSFEYKFFEDKPIDKFESLILRNSGNDNMGLQFHDCFMTGLTRKMDVDRQAFQPAAVYINGQYWGLLNIREKVSNNYIAENHQVNADSVNLLQFGGDVLDGTNEGYQELINYLNQKTTLQNDADYEKARNSIDIDNFIQYELTQIYLNNRDWPGNNIKFWNTNSPGSKWRWILFDTDFGFGIWDVNDYKLNSLDFALEAYGPDWPNPPWATLILRRMVTNLNFRNNFINQFCDRLNLDFSSSRVNSDLDSLQNLYDHEIVYNFGRWWGNYDEWLGRISNRKTFGQYRPTYCRDFLRTRFSLGSGLSITVNVSGSDEGVVKINTICPSVYPFTGIYFKNLPIQMTAVPRPGYRFVKWEGTINSTEPSVTYNMAAAGTFNAVFEEDTEEEKLIVINEINYTSSPATDAKDWVEIYNNGASSVDLGEWILTDNEIDSGYVFTTGTILTPGSYLVICRNLEDFKTFYPNVSNATGNLSFKLSGEGEIVRLFDNEFNLVDKVNYGVTAPWPVDANGTGKTIELLNPSLDNELAGSWLSGLIGGTPGTENSVSIPTGKGDIQELQVQMDCFPNPFRDYTTISFSVAAAGSYRLEVMDMQGRIVKVLTEETLSPGSYWIDWTGDNVSEGVYTLRLSGNGVAQTKKMVKIK
ncbi:MAG TPA: CotH kinase family protein [Bacteroidales bacterium]|nr:CotH kinase family protein [Bacteroidales bacterium]